MAIAGAAGLALVGWLGFHATAAFQSPQDAPGIRLVSVIIPAFGLGLGRRADLVLPAHAPEDGAGPGRNSPPASMASSASAGLTVRISNYGI